MLLLALRSWILSLDKGHVATFLLLPAASQGAVSKPAKGKTGLTVVE